MFFRTGRCNGCPATSGHRPAPAGNSSFSLVSKSINSGAPASTAPPDFSSLGMIVSQSDSRSFRTVSAVKYFGAYFPAGAAAFSLCTIWCASSAASSGITCSTDRRPRPSPASSAHLVAKFPVSPLSLLRFSPQAVAVLQVALSCASSEQIFRSAPGKRHDRQRRIFIRIASPAARRP